MTSPRAVTPARDNGSQAARASLWVSRLRLIGFRSYAALEINVDARPILLTGPNGAGKTNILEAVSLLSPGRGLRNAVLSAIDHYVSDDGATVPWTVAATVETPLGPVEIGTGRASERGRERRLLRIDGKPASSQQALAEILSVIWLTPEMNRLFVESPGSRRRFLDRLVVGFDPAHATRVSAFDRARTERSRLLREGRTDPAWLAALEQSMAERSVAIAAARLDLVVSLNAVIEEIEGRFPSPRLGVAGSPEELLGEMPALDAEEHLRDALAESRNRDAEHGGTVGSHRSDLVIEFAATGMPATQCSTGEQKAMLVAVLLAHARLLARRRGVTPVLLIDEVAAHFDAERLAALFEELRGLGCQAWLSGTDMDAFVALGADARRFTVADSTLIEE